MDLRLGISLFGAVIAVGGIVWSAGQLTAEMKAMGTRLDLAVEVLEKKLDGDIGDAISRAQVMRIEIMGRIERNAAREEDSKRLLREMVLRTRERIFLLEGEITERKRWEAK